MKPVPPIEIPRLSDLSRHRIREAVFQRLDAGDLPVEEVEDAGADVTPLPVRRRRTAMIAGGAAVAAAAAAAVVVLAVRDGAPAGPSFSRVATDEAPSRVTVGEADLTLAARSAMTVSESPDGGVVVALEQGEVRCAVAPRGERPPFVVLAADVRVEVVGTRFTVRRDGEVVGVVVDEGTVRVARAGEAQLVRASGTWPVVTASGPDPEAEPEAEPEPEMAMDPMRVGRPKPARRESAPVQEKPAVDPDKEQYKKAQKAETERRPGEALAIYKQIAAGGSKWAPMALFAQAGLEAELGNKAAARRLLTEYLRRYPNVFNAPVARDQLKKLR